MTAVLVSAAAVFAGGAYLRWALAPVRAAFRIGAVLGRMR